MKIVRWMHLSSQFNSFNKNISNTKKIIISNLWLKSIIVFLLRLNTLVIPTAIIIRSSILSTFYIFESIQFSHWHVSLWEGCCVLRCFQPQTKFNSLKSNSSSNLFQDSIHYFKSQFTTVFVLHFTAFKFGMWLSGTFVLFVCLSFLCFFLASVFVPFCCLVFCSVHTHQLG